MSANIALWVTVLKTGPFERAKAARALGNLAGSSQALSEAIMSVGALQPLVTLLEEGSSGEKDMAAYALGHLAADSVQRSAQIVDAGALEPLVKLLKEGSTAAKDMAGHALEHLSRQCCESGKMHDH